MEMAYTLGKPFASLGERVLYSYVAAFPPFVPDPALGDPEAQRQLHDFLGDVARRCYEDPSLIGVPELPDDCFEHPHTLNKENPELVKSIGLVQKRMYTFLELLQKLGTLGEIAGETLVVQKSEFRINANTQARLAAFGLVCEVTPDAFHFRQAQYPGLFPALQQRTELMQAAEGFAALGSNRAIGFLLGLYPGRHYSVAQLFGKLYADPSALSRVDAFFRSLGYDYVHNIADLRVSLHKVYPDKDYGNFIAQFRVRDKEQMCYSYRIPQFRRLLTFYDEMPAEMQEACFHRTKTCDGCGYCTQTDKTGKRARLDTPLTWQGQTLRKCPLWPYFGWNELTEETLDGMEYIYHFVEKKIYGIDPPEGK